MGEYFLYLLFAVVIVAILAAIIYFLNNKFTKELKEAMAKVSKEDLERIKMSKIEQSTENNKEYTTEGIVLEVKNDNNVTKADILFYNNFFGGYEVTKNVVCKKQVKVGDFVTTVHKKDKDIGMKKVKEIL
ncbi:MAG: hypothetical protein IJH12_07280 [Clostridia bacterium]|nr:hypothetical protein [Clostridia bacterium]